MSENDTSYVNIYIMLGSRATAVLLLLLLLLYRCPVEVATNQTESTKIAKAFKTQKHTVRVQLQVQVQGTVPLELYSSLSY